MNSSLSHRLCNDYLLQVANQQLLMQDYFKETNSFGFPKAQQMSERSLQGVKGTQMRNYTPKRGRKTIKRIARSAKHSTMGSTCIPLLSIQSWNTTQFNGSEQIDLIVDNLQFSLWVRSLLRDENFKLPIYLFIEMAT